MMSEQLLKEGPHLPTDDRTLARLRRAIELGELEQLSTVPGIPNTPRYLVTYMNSQTADSATRSATVISVTNQSELINRVFVTFFQRLHGRLVAGGHGQCSPSRRSSRSTARHRSPIARNA